MKIAITGTSGLIGSRLVDYLRAREHVIFPVVRGVAGAGEISWKPSQDEIDLDALEGMDAIIHLAGEPIQGRWTESKRKRIMDSRTQGTQLLATAIGKLKDPPRTFISASAIGFYGDRKKEELTESSRAGRGFLAKVCLAWEAASAGTTSVGPIRVVNPRLGIVIAKDGGALSKMLPAYQMGLGGKIGSGEQFMSWISIEDVMGAMLHILNKPEIEGAVNLTTPWAVTNKEFTRTLGKVLGRPTFIPLPKAVVKLTMGEMGNALLLDSTRVLPQRLLQTGFRFRHRKLEDALKAALK